MSEPSSKTKSRVNQFISIVLVLFIFAAVNAIAFKRYYQTNVSIIDYTELGDQTKNILANLPGKVTIINFASTSTQDKGAIAIMDDVRKSLAKYDYYGKDNLTVQTVDPYFNFKEGSEVSQKYQVAGEENVIIVAYKDQKKILNYYDLADVSVPPDYAGGGPAKVMNFKLEQQLTSTIRSLVEGKKSKIYFLTGHGEYDPMAAYDSKTGYSLLTEHIKRQNVDVEKLNLVATPSIPDDMDLLVIAGPNKPVTAIEKEILAQYLAQTDKPSRLILLLDPKTQTGLEDLLKPYGVTFDNDLLLTKISLLGQIRVLGETVATTFAKHPVMDWMAGGDANLSLSSTRSLTVGKQDGGLNAQVVPLILTPEVYWGETDLDNKAPEFNEGQDTKGPFTVAVAIDTGSVSDGGVNLKGDRIIAMGSGSFLINHMIGAPQLDLFLNSMNWMLDKQEALGITAKTPQEFKVTLETVKLIWLLGLLLAIPLAGGIIGFLVWLRRRN